MGADQRLIVWPWETETYTVYMIANVPQGGWLRSNPLTFDVKSRIVFWYDSTSDAIDNGSPEAVGFAGALGQTGDQVDGDARVLVCIGAWDDAWSYQTQRGQFWSSDHGGYAYVDDNGNGQADPTDRGTYGMINLGDANTSCHGFGQNGVLIGGPNHALQPLYIEGIRVYLCHCFTASESCGHLDQPNNPWPQMAVIDQQQGPRIIDTMGAVGGGVGNGTVFGYHGLYGYAFSTSIAADGVNLTQAQLDQSGTYASSLSPLTWSAFSSQHGGTDAGWSSYLSELTTLWARSQFNNPAIVITLTLSHTLTEGSNNGNNLRSQTYN